MGKRCEEKVHARIEFKDTGDIFAKKCYNDKVLVVKELRTKGKMYKKLM